MQNSFHISIWQAPNEIKDMRPKRWLVCFARIKCAKNRLFQMIYKCLFNIVFILRHRNIFHFICFSCALPRCLSAVCSNLLQLTIRPSCFWFLACTARQRRLMTMSENERIQIFYYLFVDLCGREHENLSIHWTNWFASMFGSRCCVCVGNDKWWNRFNSFFRLYREWIWNDRMRQ